MMPDQKRELQAYLDANFEALKNGDHDAKEGLKDAIRRTFPREGAEGNQVGSLEELGRILKGESEYALLIRNCPEREGLEHAKTFDAKDAYSFHIGNALYEMNQAEHVWEHVFKRSKSKPNRGEGLDYLIHRDAVPKPNESNAIPDIGKYAIFSAPYNGEQAVTEVIHLRRALESLPEEVRRRIQVDVKTRFISDWYDDISPGNLDQVLQGLKIHPEQDGFVNDIRLVDSNNPSDIRQLDSAIKQYGKKIPLEIGDILILNEDSMFHRAHVGDLSIIEQLSQDTTRWLIHNGGAPIGQHR